MRHVSHLVVAGGFLPVYERHPRAEGRCRSQAGTSAYAPTFCDFWGSRVASAAPGPMASAQRHPARYAAIRKHRQGPRVGARRGEAADEFA